MGNRRRSCSRRVTNTLVAGALVLGGSSAIAAAPDRLYEDEIAEEAGSLEVDDVSDDDLHGFIEAAHEIQKIRASYAQKIRDADGEERAALQVEAAEKMAEAVEDQGLEVSEYREIGYLLENDADLPDRLDGVAAGTS